MRKGTSYYLKSASKVRDQEATAVAAILVGAMVVLELTQGARALLQKYD
jgi:hypothetical protein